MIWRDEKSAQKPSRHNGREEITWTPLL